MWADSGSAAWAAGGKGGALRCIPGARGGATSAEIPNFIFNSDDTCTGEIAGLAADGSRSGEYEVGFDRCVLGTRPLLPLTIPWYQPCHED